MWFIRIGVITKFIIVDHTVQPIFQEALMIDDFGSEFFVILIMILYIRPLSHPIPKVLDELCHRWRR